MRNIIDKAAFRLLLSIPFITIAVMMLFYTTNVPSWYDYDAILAHANLTTAEQFKHLFAFHNEHRIVPVRLVASLYNLLLGPINFRAFMCIGNILWCAFAAFFATIFLRHKGEWHWRLSAISAVWFILGFYDYENACWAMTAIQNHWVVVFAFLSFWAFEKGWSGFICALALATMATFTSGAGMCAFPALAFTTIMRHYTTTKADRASVNIPKTVIFMAVSILAIDAYFQGFPTKAVSPTNTDAAASISARGILILRFTACFLGNILPYAIPATLLGSAMLVATLPALYFFPKFSPTSRAMFTFLIFIGGTIVSCALFRAEDTTYALPGRYRIYSACYLTTLLHVILSEYKMRDDCKKGIALLAFAAIFSLSTAYDVKSPKIVAHSKAALENNVQLWPETIEGLHYPDLKVGNEIMQESIKQETYDPRVIREKSPQRPTTLIPWKIQ